MFLNEGLALDPDVVTFYEGANDSAIIDTRESRPGSGWYEALIRHLLTVALFDRLVPHSAAADTEWWWSDEQAQERTRSFLANLDRLHEECVRRGIHLIVATQQLKSMLVRNDEMPGLTYEQEFAIVRDKVARGEIGPHARDVNGAAFQLRLNAGDDTAVRTVNMADPPRAMLVHARVMQALPGWATRNHVGFVDVIAELDGQRELLVTWVHLRAAGNAILAKALAREIRRQLSLGIAGSPAATVE